MLHLSKIYLKGYKSIRNTEITFCEGLNIVIGQNGSGKTNFFEFLEDVLQTAQRESYNTNYNSKILELLNTGQSIEAKIVWNSERQHDYVLELATLQIVSSNKEELPKNRVEMNFYCTDEQKTPFITSFVSRFFYIKYGITTSLAGLANDFDWVLSPHYKTDNEASIVEKILYQNYDSHVVAVEDYESYLPNHTLLAVPKQFLAALSTYTLIKDFRITCSNDWRKDRAGNSILYGINTEFFIHEAWWRWRDLSDGTKRLFHIIGHIILKAFGTIIIEEPELGLHPHQLFELMGFIKKELSIRKDLQIILTTHAPQVLDCLDVDSELDRIIITQITDNGTAMRRLTEEQQNDARQFVETNNIFLRDYWIHAGLERQNIEFL